VARGTHDKETFVNTKKPTPAAAAPRRRFLKRAATAVGTAGALSAPMLAQAQTTSMRFQSTWPSKDIFHEYALDFARRSTT
jgi:TRAP-type mannitol/chloroaromatic compound transport system substrate-binding protein